MTKPEIMDEILGTLQRIATGIEVISGSGTTPEVSLGAADAYHWDGATKTLNPVDKVNRIPLDLLQGIDNSTEILVANTLQFAMGNGANNALLWGARGMGKSSLVKAVHAEIAQRDIDGPRLILVEINRDDVTTLPALMRAISDLQERFIIFCDDLSFDKDESLYKSLKTILDGGLEGRTENAVFYATSNRRHLMPRDMIENERSTAINPSESVQEKVSLSDRFGLWLGFHGCDQPTYLEMVKRYFMHYGIEMSDRDRDAKAIEWAAGRGARSGRVAIQFVRHIGGAQGKSI